MKKKYEKPNMDLEMFEANEYIAACWDIACNVPNGTGYKDNNGVPGLQSKGYRENGKWIPADQAIGSGTGCGNIHSGSIDDSGPYANALWKPSGAIDSEAYPVYYWSTGKYWKTPHFSKVEDANWAPNPNAS